MSPSSSPTSSARQIVEVDGKQLSVSNLDKVMFPATGFTKGELIHYYRRIAPAMLPHLDQRPITLVRYPNGVDGKFFFEKNCPAHRPSWIRTVTINGVSRGGKGEAVNFCLLESVAHLVWTANLAAIELHPGLAGAPHTDRPLCVVFDLDPGAPADVLTCAHIAIILRELLEHLGLQSFVKTSGSKGLQVYAPLNTPVTFDRTRDFALAIGQLLERQHPDLVTTNMSKDLRPGKILVDWSQNVASKTTVAVYSLRARERPTVSTPVTWDEVATALANDDAAALRFEAPKVLDRVDEHGDLFAPVVTLEQHLPD